jgi:outer membrane lipoprotein-sorting protein
MWAKGKCSQEILTTGLVNAAMPIIRSLRAMPKLWMLNLAAVALTASLAISHTAWGNDTTVNRKELAKAAESWINGLKTFQAQFRQTTSSGHLALGEILIARPGRMFIKYSDPRGLEVYADGRWMIYLDRTLKEVNQIPISATPARIFLEDNVKFDKDLTVSVTDLDDRYQLLLSQRNSPEDGRIALSFSKSPLQLKSWTIWDAQGVETTVSLSEIKENRPINLNRLNYYAPEWAFQ